MRISEMQISNEWRAWPRVRTRLLIAVPLASLVALMSIGQAARDALAHGAVDGDSHERSSALDGTPRSPSDGAILVADHDRDQYKRKKYKHRKRKKFKHRHLHVVEPKLEFHGSRITSNAGLLAYRELDHALAP